MYKCTACTYALGWRNLTSSFYTHINRLNYYPYCKPCRSYMQYNDIISYFSYYVSTIVYSPRYISASHSCFNTVRPHLSLYLIICLYFLPLPFISISCHMNDVLISMLLRLRLRQRIKCGQFEKKKRHFVADIKLVQGRVINNLYLPFKML